jgi:LmbE family N-acetylglucosaminyl deacetylase
VFAHPDNKSLGCGSTLAKYAADGVDIYLICATKGERGWMGDKKDDPGPTEFGKIRELELCCSAETLGIKKVIFLDYINGGLDQADHNEATNKIADLIREIRPQVTLSFQVDGAYGHPDHIAISQLLSSACVRAATSAYQSPIN